jgi:hypothetical protein
MTRADEIDALYDRLDDLLLTGRMNEARQELAAMAETEDRLHLLLSALAVTYPWRAGLEEVRAAIRERARKIAFDLGGESKVDEITLISGHD